MRSRHVLFCCLNFFFGIIVTPLQAAEIKVDSTADPGPLRDAIIGAAPGDVVLLRAEGEVLLTSPLPVRRGIRIEGQSGPLAHTLKVSGDFRHFDVSGLPVDETATIARLTLEGNLPEDAGGGISSRSNLLLESVQVVDSSAEHGGAIAQTGASLGIDLSYFARNESELAGGLEGSGGAVYASGAELTVTSTGFVSNVAGSGGAIAFAGPDSSLIVRSSTFSGNRAVISGGAVSLASGDGRFINLTLVDNNSGADTLSHINAGTNAITVGNSLVVGEGDGLPGILGDLQAEGTGTNRSGTDLSLGLGMPAGAYGGLRPTYLLHPGRTALPDGSNLLLPETDRDQRGLARFSDGDGEGGDIVDQGAFEVQHYKVSALQIRGSATGGKDDGGYGNPFDPSDDADSIASADVFVQLTNTNKADIGDAVGANNAAGGGSVSFDERTWGGRVVLKGRELEVRRDIAIYGPGATRMFIDGSASSPVFRIGEAGQDVLAYMEGISIENGLAETGAGIVVQDGGRVSLKEVQLKGNSASLAGGGIAVLSGATDLYRSSLIDNQAGDQGGGIFGSIDSVIVIDTSTLSGNSAGSMGGAVASSGDLTIDSSTIVANGANSNTGLLVEGATGIIQNTILSLGTADTIDAGSGTSVNSGGYNLSEASEGGFLLNATDLSGTDPELNVRSLNDGETLSHAPKGTSPAIDAGSSYFPLVDGQLDQPGNDRVKGAAIDIGSVELQNDSPTIECISEPDTECVSSSGALVAVDVLVDDVDKDDLTVTWSAAGVSETQNVAGAELPLASPLSQDLLLPIGTTTVTITVSDGFTSASCAVMVKVADTTAPTVTLSGPTSINLECGIDAYVEYGATASDICDPGPTVVISPILDSYPETGTYTVTYTAADAAGNSSSATRTVNVVDTTDPVVTLNGSALVTLQCGVDTFSDPGATALDDCEGALDVGLPVRTDLELLTENSVETYRLTYSVTDSSGNTGSASRVVDVIDTVAPSISLNQPDYGTIVCGVDSYVEYGASATDNCQTSISVGAPIRTDLPLASVDSFETYLLTYTATDATGNAASVSRTVDIIDNSAPTFTSVPADSQPLTDAGYCFATVEFEAVATDTCDTDLTITYDILPNEAYPDGLNGIQSGHRFPPLPDGQGGWLPHVVRVTATDDTGKSVSDTFDVTVEDKYNNCAFNVAWPASLDLSFEQRDGFVEATQQQLLGLTDQSRWYKFSVTPGSRVTIILSSLPANYDIVVYRDIREEFERILDLFLNGTSEEQELSLLGAEFAPESFTPESFLPESFLPESFLPESFLPESFLPESFLPESFIAEAFSPESFLPESFIPESFLVDSYSPESFLPESFLPESFLPESFLPESFLPESFIGEENFTPESFIAAQLSSMIAYSAFPGVASEGVTINTYTTSGDFYVRVRGANGVFDGINPFTLSVFIEEEVCGDPDGEGPLTGVQGPESFAGAVPQGLAGDFQTLILWDSSRTAGSDTDIATLGSMLETFKQRTEVNGEIIDLALQDRVVEANIQADAYPTCPYAKNLVAEEIKAVIDAWRDSTTVDGVSSLKYIMLLGNDDVIPFFRTTDQAFLANESNYVPPVRDNNHSQSSLRYGQILTQDPYGADCVVNLSTGPYPYGGLAVGRLVESAADMIGQLENYNALSGGLLPVPDTALVTGYDFLDDLAGAVEFELEAALGSQIDTLVDASTTAPADGWTATELADIFLGSHHDIVFLAGHFSTGSALAADYETRLTAAQVRESGADLLNTLIFSIGCHSGYNTVDSHAINGITKQPDWAQAFAQMGATLIAGTGYQYGDTEFVEYSERLYLEMVRQLRTGPGAVSVGEALVNAKKKYLAETELMRGIHEKSLLQATLFGFPMLKMNVPGDRITSPSGSSVVPASLPVVGSNPGQYLGLSAHDLNLDYSSLPLVEPNTLTVFDPGADPGDKSDDTEYTLKWYEGGNGIVSNPIEPVRPLDSYFVSVPGNLLRGVGFRGGDYIDESNFLTLTGAPTTEIRGVFGEFITEVFYPVQPYSTNYFGAICGANEGERLNVYRTQYYNPDDGIEGGTLRKYSSMNFRLYYNNNRETYYNANGDAIIPALTAPPSISRVLSSTDGSSVDFDITVLASPAVGVQEVWITYTGIPGSALHGSWQSFDLGQGALPDTMVWSGNLPLPEGVHPDEVRFMVQAASGIGLVSLKSNFGQYYQVGVDELAARMTSEISITEVLPAAADYGYGETLTVKALLKGYSESSQSFEALAGKRVGIRVGASRVSGTTGADGIVTLDLPLQVRPATELLQAYFTGDLLFSPSAVDQPITITKQDTVLAFDEGIPVPPNEIFGSDVVVSLRDAIGTPLKERTVFFLVDYGSFQIGNSVITDIAGRADLSEIFLPSGSATITAYFNGTIPLPDADPVTITDLLYKAATPVSIDVLLDQPIREDSLGFDPQQVDIYYKSSGNGRNAIPLYENASIAGDVAFNVPLQPDDLTADLENPDYISGYVFATLAGEVIVDEPVTLDTRGDNGNHWTTTSQPGQAAAYVGIHWSDAPRFDSALSESPGPRISTVFIGNNFTEFRYVPLPGTGSYTTTFPNGGPTIVVKRGVVDPEASGLAEGEYGLDEGGLVFTVKFGLEPGMSFLTRDSSNNNPFPDIEVEVIPEINYLTEGGRMIIRLQAVPGMPEFPPASNAEPNLFECRFILGPDDGVQVRSIARIGEGLYAIPWTSEDPGHKQYR
ncbi:MAG: immunoglobulin-like domain-containing protein [Puniceicoccaceae bacterium]